MDRRGSWWAQAKALSVACLLALNWFMITYRLTSLSIKCSSPVIMLHRSALMSSRSSTAHHRRTIRSDGKRLLIRQTSCCIRIHWSQLSGILIWNSFQVSCFSRFLRSLFTSFRLIFWTLLQGSPVDDQCELKRSQGFHNRPGTSRLLLSLLTDWFVCTQMFGSRWNCSRNSFLPNGNFTTNKRSYSARQCRLSIRRFSILT